MDEVIELAGLAEVAGTRAGGFSLGMGQRLGVAAALLGQPRTVVLDEPVNGLDPNGVRWIRLLLKSLADEGRTVFVSSHLMSEMARTASQLVVLGRGKLITEASVEDFTSHATAGNVLVRTPETVRLGQVLAVPGVTVVNDGTDVIRVTGTTAEQIGTAAWRAHLPVYGARPHPRFAGRGIHASDQGQHRVPRWSDAMSAPAVQAPTTAPALAPATVAGPVSQARVIRAEWTKLQGLRSTWWCGLSAVVLIVGLGAAIAEGARRTRSRPLIPPRWGSRGFPDWPVVRPADARRGRRARVQRRVRNRDDPRHAGVVLSRLPVLWAKLIVLAGLVLPVTLLCAVADFFTATALLSSRGGSVISLTDPGVLRTVAGSSLYLTVVVVIGLALGALLRKTAAGLSVFAAVFFVVPIVVGALPHQITGFAPYLPANAGGALWGNTLTTGHELSPWAGFAVLCGYAIVLTGLAAWRLRRRDA